MTDAERPDPNATEGVTDYMEPTRRGVSQALIDGAPELRVAVWFDHMAFALSVENARKLAEALTTLCAELDAEPAPSST